MTEPGDWITLLENFLICFLQVSFCLPQQVLKIALSAKEKGRQEGTYKALHSHEEHSKHGYILTI